jgi:hypothetical protein
LLTSQKDCVAYSLFLIVLMNESMTSEVISFCTFLSQLFLTAIAVKLHEGT